MAVRPTVKAICSRTRLPQKVVSFVAVLFVFLLILGLLTALCGRMVGELRELSDDLMADAAGIVEDLFDSIRSLTERLPFPDRADHPEAADRIRQAVTSMIEDTVSRFSAGIPAALMSFLAALPGILIFTIVMIVATFYLGNDVSAVNAFIARQLPASSRHYRFEAKAKLADAAVK
jgi:predicted PurR-regulated permease PerM